MEQENAFVFNKTEYVNLGWFTEEELNNADGVGYVGGRYGCACYVSTFIPAYSETNPTVNK